MTCPLPLLPFSPPSLPPPLPPLPPQVEGSTLSFCHGETPRLLLFIRRPHGSTRSKEEFQVSEGGKEGRRQGRERQE